jgi:hypothetical protein
VPAARRGHVLRLEGAARFGDAAFQHQVVVPVEFLDRHALGILPGAIRPPPRRPAQPRQHPAAEALRHVAVAEDRPAECPHEAELIDRADIGRGAAERGQVGDQRVAAADMRLVRLVDAAPFRQGRVRHQRRRLEREDPGQPLRGTDGPLGGGDVRRIGKEDLGPGQIESHRIF